MTTAIMGWHWLRNPGQLSDGTPLTQSVALNAGQRPVLGKLGFHASREPLSALFFAPGPYVCRVRLAGMLDEDAIQAVGRRRDIVAGPVDATRVLRRFAAECARTALVAFEVRHPDDLRIRRAIEVASRHADGNASDQDLQAARSAALSAVRDESDPGAEHAAWAAADAAHPIAECAAWWAAWESDFSPNWGRAWSDHDVVLTRMLRTLLRPATNPAQSHQSELFA